jgi:hypothetical protein
MTLDDVSQPHLAVAVVDRCGGRVQFVPWERVAIAIWRAFPDRASLRTGLLPDTYSMQTWVWDAKTKLAFLSGGTREGGWRVTPKGASWLDANTDIQSLVRGLLLEPADYVDVDRPSLVAASLDTSTTPRAALAIEAFRRFPGVFGLAPTRVWPDLSLVDAALSEAKDVDLVTERSDGFALTTAGVMRKGVIESKIGAHRQAAAAGRRSIAGQYITRVEATAAYHTYLDSGDRSAGSADELYVLMRCPPNAGVALAEASLAELLDNLSRGDRPDLVEFVSRWAERCVPDLKGYVGGRQR